MATYAEDVARRLEVDPRLLERPCDEAVLPSLATFVHPWREVFSFLLAPLDLDDVNAECLSGQEKRLFSLRKWKERRGKKATYAELVNALLKNGNLDKAEELCLHVQKEREMAAAQSASNTPDVAEPAKKQDGAKIKKLEKQFLSLQKRFLAELKKDDSVTADTLLGTLYILPVELKVEYGKFLDEKIPTLEQQGTVLTIFGQLSRHFTFLDHGLLGHLIEELGSEKLQQDMMAYVASVEVFLDETSVQQLIDYWPSQRTTPPDFEELKAIVYRHPKLYSLRQLEDLRKDLCSETHLSQMVLVLKTVGRSKSFTVSWLVPCALASQLMVSLTQVSDTFYQREHIYSISMNQQQLYCSVAMRERKFECERRLIVLCVENIGDISEFSHLLAQPGVDPDVRDKEGGTLLWNVCYDGRTDIAEVLITYGADIDLPSENEFGESPLFAASCQGHTSTCSLLLEKGAKVDFANKNGVTPLYMASQEGHTAVVSVLIDGGATVDLPNQNGATALYVASQEGHTPIVTMLLDRGADVDHPNKDGFTALRVASACGQSDVARVLIEKGATVDYEDKNGFTALHVASAHGQSDVVRVLIEKGATIDYEDKNGWSPLHYASAHGRTSSVDILVNSGSLVDLQTKAGYTPLNLASYHGHKDIVELLLTAGASPDIQDEYGLTPLILATQQRHKDVAEILLKFRANTNVIEPVSGWSPVFFACKQGSVEMARLLLTHGADVQLQDKNRVTAYDIAKLHGNDEICSLLQNYHNIKEKEITEEQKEKTKVSFQRLRKIFDALKKTLLPSRTEKEKQKQAKDKKRSIDPSEKTAELSLVAH